MTSEATMIRLLIVDDHEMIRDGLTAILNAESDMRVVASGSNGHDAIREFREHRPDVVLMDLQMPECDGVKAIEAICGEWPAARIVALTTYKGDVQAVRALKAGARGYLLKGMARQELTDAIRAVHAGRRHLPPEVAVDLGINAVQESLSARELEVLLELARGGANKVIATRLSVTEETVKAHMKNILMKLGATDRANALSIAVKRGIINLWD